MKKILFITLIIITVCIFCFVPNTEAETKHELMYSISSAQQAYCVGNICGTHNDPFYSPPWWEVTLVETDNGRGKHLKSPCDSCKSCRWKWRIIYMGPDESVIFWEVSSGTGAVTNGYFNEDLYVSCLRCGTIAFSDYNPDTATGNIYYINMWCSCQGMADPCPQHFSRDPLDKLSYDLALMAERSDQAIKLSK